ncbi:MAG: helix-hairpin-helix domain-containing protein [Bacteroidales bacterium]|nr:helix-hairpin-helix domain-containing protein [Bacteroidales bacterium]
MKTSPARRLCLLLIAYPLFLTAQERDLTTLTGTASVEELDEDEYERLESLRAAPVRINTASLAQLQSCGLFTRFQALSLTDYRTRNGDILSPAELGLVDGFSPDRVQALTPFLSFFSRNRPGQAGQEQLHQDLVARGEYRNGAFGYAVKYRMAKDERGALALTARSSAREKPGAPDTWSFQATKYLRRRTGKILLGDYNARFGQGLALWNGFSMSGLTTAENFARHPTGLSPAWSFSPDAPLRGVAGDLTLRGWSLSAAAVFPGLRARMDGNPKAQVSAFGAGNASWTGRKAEFSVTALWGPEQNGQASKLAADFRWTPGAAGVFGEWAWDLRNQRLAAVGGLTWSPAYQKKLSVLIRHYPVGFDADLTGGVRAGSRCSGESGVAAGLRLPWIRFTADYARFPARDLAQTRLLCLLPLILPQGWNLTPRVSLRWRNGILREEYRLETLWDDSPWQVKIRGDLVRCSGTSWLAYAEGGRKTERWRIYARAGIFKIDEWDDRIYVYERDVPGCFHVPAYYGRGVNASLVGGARWRRHTLSLRIGGIRYVTDKPGRFECRMQYSWSR